MLLQQVKKGGVKQTHVEYNFNQIIMFSVIVNKCPRPNASQMKNNIMRNNNQHSTTIKGIRKQQNRLKYTRNNV